MQSDGKILVGGDFTTYNNVSRTYLARLNSDGSLDNTFNAVISTSTAAGTLRSIVPLSDGTIYIGGGIASVGGASREYLARINSTGSLDTSFSPPAGINSYVETILPVNGGQILVGGSFISFNAIDPNALLRLNSNGSKDSTFNAKLAQSNIVYNLVPQPGGKILVSGSLTSINGVNRRGIVRINPDGSSDATFNINAGTNGTINATALQSDGKILIGGQFLSYNGVNQAPLARLIGVPLTAADASISGRVLAGGKGVANARVELTGTGGTTRIVTTNSFGNFTINEVESGATYVVNVAAKRYSFASQVVSVTDNVSDLTFTAQ